MNQNLAHMRENNVNELAFGDNDADDEFSPGVPSDVAVASPVDHDDRGSQKQEEQKQEQKQPERSKDRQHQHHCEQEQMHGAKQQKVKVKREVLRSQVHTFEKFDNYDFDEIMGNRNTRTAFEKCWAVVAKLEAEVEVEKARWVSKAMETRWTGDSSILNVNGSDDESDDEGSPPWMRIRESYREMAEDEDSGYSIRQGDNHHSIAARARVSSQPIPGRIRQNSIVQIQTTTPVLRAVPFEHFQLLGEVARKDEARRGRTMRAWQKLVKKTNDEIDVLMMRTRRDAMRESIEQQLPIHVELPPQQQQIQRQQQGTGLPSNYGFQRTRASGGTSSFGNLNLIRDQNPNRNLENLPSNSNAPPRPPLFNVRAPLSRDSTAALQHLNATIKRLTAVKLKFDATVPKTTKALEDETVLTLRVDFLEEETGAVPVTLDYGGPSASYIYQLFGAIASKVREGSNSSPSSQSASSSQLSSAFPGLVYDRTFTQLIKPHYAVPVDLPAVLLEKTNIARGGNRESPSPISVNSGNHNLNSRSHSIVSGSANGAINSAMSSNTVNNGVNWIGLPVSAPTTAFSERDKFDSMSVQPEFPQDQPTKILQTLGQILAYLFRRPERTKMPLTGWWPNTTPTGSFLPKSVFSGICLIKQAESELSKGKAVSTGRVSTGQDRQPGDAKAAKLTFPLPSDRRFLTKAGLAKAMAVYESDRKHIPKVQEIQKNMEADTDDRNGNTNRRESRRGSRATRADGRSNTSQPELTFVTGPFLGKSAENIRGGQKSYTRNPRQNEDKKMTTAHANMAVFLQWAKDMNELEMRSSKQSTSSTLIHRLLKMLVREELRNMQTGGQAGLRGESEGFDYADPEKDRIEPDLLIHLLAVLDAAPPAAPAGGRVAVTVSNFSRSSIEDVKNSSKVPPLPTAQEKAFLQQLRDSYDKIAPALVKSLLVGGEEGWRHLLTGAFELDDLQPGVEKFLLQENSKDKVGEAMIGEPVKVGESSWFRYMYRFGDKYDDARPDELVRDAVLAEDPSLALNCNTKLLKQKILYLMDEIGLEMNPTSVASKLRSSFFMHRVAEAEKYLRLGYEATSRIRTIPFTDRQIRVQDNPVYRAVLALVYRRYASDIMGIFLVASGVPEAFRWSEACGCSTSEVHQADRGLEEGEPTATARHAANRNSASGAANFDSGAGAPARGLSATTSNLRPAQNTSFRNADQNPSDRNDNTRRVLLPSANSVLQNAPSLATTASSFGSPPLRAQIRNDMPNLNDRTRLNSVGAIGSAAPRPSDFPRVNAAMPVTPVPVIDFQNAPSLRRPSHVNPQAAASFTASRGIFQDPQFSIPMRPANFHSITRISNGANDHRNRQTGMPTNNPFTFGTLGPSTVSNEHDNPSTGAVVIPAIEDVHRQIMAKTAPTVQHSLPKVQQPPATQQRQAAEQPATNADLGSLALDAELTFGVDFASHDLGGGSRFAAKVQGMLRRKLESEYNC